MIMNKVNVGGVAIVPGISKNGVLYTVEVLNEFAPTLNGRPILKDHRSETDNTIGLVTSSGSNGAGVVSYNGWIKEDGTKILEKIGDGRIKEVSIGAFAETVLYDEELEVYIVEGLEAMELSTTPTPAVKGTSLRQTLEDINIKKTNENHKVRPCFESNIMKFEIKEKVLPVIEKFNEDTPDVSISNKKEETNMVEKTRDEIEAEVREKIIAEQKADVEQKAQLKEEIRNEVIKEMAETKEKIKTELREEIEAELKEKSDVKEDAEDKSEDKEEDKKPEEKEEKEEKSDETDEKSDDKEEKEENSEEKTDDSNDTEDNKDEKSEGAEEKEDDKKSEESAKMLKGKIKTEDAAETQEDAAGTYVMEDCAFGKGRTLFKQPKPNGSYM